MRIARQLQRYSEAELVREIREGRAYVDTDKNGNDYILPLISGGSFPDAATTLRDDFAGSGALNGNWTQWAGSFYTSPMLRATDQVRGTASSPSGNAFTGAGTMGPDAEAYITFVTAGDFGGIFIRSNNTSDTHGYLLTWIASGNIFRIDAPSGTIASTTQALSNGDKFGIQAIGTTIKAFYQASGGSWVEKLSVTNGEITGAGYPGMFANNHTVFYDEFYAGSLGGGGGSLGWHGRGTLMGIM